MPTTSAQVKIDAVRSHNAEVVFVDTAVQTRADKVKEVVVDYPEYHIASPYDCEWVIRGTHHLDMRFTRTSSQSTI